MTRISVYCAKCLRPLRDGVSRVRVRTETCRRGLEWKRGTTEAGVEYLASDGTEVCSVEVVFP